MSSNDTILLRMSQSDVIDIANSTINSTTADANVTLSIIYTVVVPVLLVICILSMFANIYILIAVLCLHTREKTPNLNFTLSLSAADAWVAFCMAISFVINSFLEKVAKYQLYNISCYLLAFEGFRMGAMITAMLHLLLLAMNHYVGILRPLHYNATMTPEITVGAIIVLWLVPPAVLLIWFSAITGQGFQSKDCREVGFYMRQDLRVTVSLFLFVPLTLMVFIYVHIFVVIYRSQAQNVSRPPQLQRKTKAIVTTLLVVGTFVIGWMPAVIRFVLVCLDCLLVGKMNPLVSVVWGLISNLLILVKCLMDPVIYAYRVREVKLGLWVLHHTRCGLRKLPGLDRKSTFRLTVSYASTCRKNPSRVPSFNVSHYGETLRRVSQKSPDKASTPISDQNCNTSTPLSVRGCHQMYTTNGYFTSLDPGGLGLGQVAGTTNHVRNGSLSIPGGRHACVVRECRMAAAGGTPPSSMCQTNLHVPLRDPRVILDRHLRDEVSFFENIVANSKETFV